MLFSSENWDDIRKYYLNTYIKIKEAGDELFFINRVDRAQVSGIVENGGEFVIYLDDANPYEIDYVLPHKSYFQLDKDAVQLYRSPAKQYQRGLNTSNTKVVRLNRAGEQESLSEGGLDFKVLKAFVEKQPFRTLAQAIDKNAPVANSFVLSPRMMFHRVTKGLYIDFVRVANVHTGDRTITMIHPVFTDEVKTLLKQNNETELFKVL